MLLRSLPFLTLPLLATGWLIASEPVRFDDLPHKISSFGACVCDGHVYVYGGHTGTTHKYSAITTTGKFFRAKLSGGAWEELPSGPRAQGLALVAHKGKIYRVGGMQPRNQPQDRADNHSLASFAVYDPASRKWQELEPLPQGRSSHDAVVCGDKLHVFGGWKMNGAGQEPTWHTTGLVIDLASAGAKWQTITQPFQRRALAVESLADKVFVLGGLSPEKGAKTNASVYDLASGSWSEAAPLPNKSTSMGTGFSPAACVQGGRLFVSTNDGLIHRLSKDGMAWEEAGRQQQSRFVPRLVTGENGALIVLGGNARMDARKVEVILPR